MTKLRSALVILLLAPMLLLVAATESSARPSQPQRTLAQAGCNVGYFCAYDGPNFSGQLVVSSYGNWSSGGVPARSVFNNGHSDPGQDHIDLSWTNGAGEWLVSCLHYNPDPGSRIADLGSGARIYSITWRGECADASHSGGDENSAPHQPDPSEGEAPHTPQPTDCANDEPICHGTGTPPPDSGEVPITPPPSSGEAPQPSQPPTTSDPVDDTTKPHVPWCTADEWDGIRDLMEEVLGEEGPCVLFPEDPILFVHGFKSDGGTWEWMINRFVEAGYPRGHLLAISYDWKTSNAETAEDVAEAVAEMKEEAMVDKVDIVTHSMGGLNSRYYLKFLDGAPHVDDWVSLGGPNHGTRLANKADDLIPVGCRLLIETCGELREGSPFIERLNEGDETPGDVDYATFWSSCDGVIRPPQSTILDGATNTEVVCRSITVCDQNPNPEVPCPDLREDHTSLQSRDDVFEPLYGFVTS